MVPTNGEESVSPEDIDRLGKAHVDVLNVIKEEGRVNPHRLRELTPHRKQRINAVLSDLEERYGMISKVTYALYEHREDPPQLTCDECGRIYRSPRGVSVHKASRHRDGGEQR